MIRLGVVLGGVLAELARAQVAVDQRVREQIGELEETKSRSWREIGPRRFVVESATIRIKFGMENVEAPEPEFIPGDLASRFERSVVGSALRSTVRKLGGSADLERDLLEQVKLGRPSAARMEGALSGNLAPVVESVVAPALNSWDRLSVQSRRGLGGKEKFEKTLKQTVSDGLDVFLITEKGLAYSKAALSSELMVEVESDKLATNPDHLQEISITVRGEELDLIIPPTKES